MKSYIVNRKILLGILTMVLVFAIVIVSSFWPFIIDPSKIGTSEFITDQMIIMAITISSMVSMMFVAQASNAQQEKSEIAKSKVEFKVSITRIIERTAFYQWVKKVLQPNDRRDIAEQGMLKLGVDFKVWDLSDSEILALTQPQKYGNTFYKALTEKQIKDIFALKKKVKNIKFVSPSYYTTYKSWFSNKNLSQIAATENTKKVLIVVVELTLKIIVSFIGAAIFASLVRDLTQEGGSSAAAWMRFLSRMFAYITSSFLGYLLGCKMNDLDAFYILKRVEVHSLYLEDKTFKPVDEAKEEFKERVLKEERKLIGQDAHLLGMKGEQNG